MKTTPYSKVLQSAAEMAGRVYSDDDGNVVLNEPEANSLRVFIRTALKHAWESAPWPELIPTERKLFAAPHDPLSTYNRGDIVWHEGTNNYYVCLTQVGQYYSPADRYYNDWVTSPFWGEVAETYDVPEWSAAIPYSQGERVRYDATGKVYQTHMAASAGTQPTVWGRWGELPIWTRYVEFTQGWETDPIGDVFNVFLDNPQTTANPREADWEGTGQGILVRDQVPAVWVRHRQHPPSLTSDPATVPFRFGELCALGAAGMMLRIDGKVELGNQYLSLSAKELEAQQANALKYIRPNRIVINA